MPQFVVSLAGIAAILAIAFVLSNGKRRIKLRIVGAAFALQMLMALLVLRTPWGVNAIQGLSNGVIALLDYSKVGISAVFGPMDANPFVNTFVIAALPVIVFFAAIVSILYHWGVMQRLVRWVGGAIGWITGISKVEALGAAANIFVGQSESPLHGWGRRHDPGGLCQLYRRGRGALPARRRLHVGARRYPDGQDHHARRRRRASARGADRAA